MVTGVGFNASSSCAAIRSGLTGFNETGFMFAGEWLIGCEVPFENGWRGRERLLRLVVPAIEECVADFSDQAIGSVPLLLCVSEKGRPGRFEGLDETLLDDVAHRTGQNRHERSEIVAGGKIGGAQALARARELVADGHPFCIVAGVDSNLVGSTLHAYDSAHRLQTAETPQGLIPGEGAAAVLIAPRSVDDGKSLRVEGIGFGHEPAPLDSGEPLRADGLVAAIRAAFQDAGLGYEDVDYRLTDLGGERYGFKEASLALLRTMRVQKETFDIWHPADCIGDIGAATVPAILSVASAATKGGYAPGSGALCHFSGSGSERASLVLRSGRERCRA